MVIKGSDHERCIERKWSVSYSPIFMKRRLHMVTYRHISRSILFSIFLATSLTSSGCMSAAQHGESLPQAKEREMTLGIVQKEIHSGMSQPDVAVALGSPNIVTRDSDGRETWIYDKIASTAAYSKSAGYGTVLVIGIFGDVGGGIAPGYSRETGAAETTQKTLTVVIKFDERSLVESFSYHASKF
jgi:outer membrane protein assembly factor BamE (lipoprotein component of BamABCDE complex)